MTCVGKYHVQWNVLYLTLIRNNAMQNNAIQSLISQREKKNYNLELNIMIWFTRTSKLKKNSKDMMI